MNFVSFLRYGPSGLSGGVYDVAYWMDQLAPAKEAVDSDALKNINLPPLSFNFTEIAGKWKKYSQNCTLINKTIHIIPLAWFSTMAIHNAKLASQTFVRQAIRFNIILTISLVALTIFSAYRGYQAHYQSMAWGLPDFTSTVYAVRLSKVAALAAARNSSN
ncbi:MAG: hypothetical protein Tsb0021_03900 [Chlamydiales bacterium]